MVMIALTTVFNFSPTLFSVETKNRSTNLTNHRLLFLQYNESVQNQSGQNQTKRCLCIITQKYSSGIDTDHFTVLRHSLISKECKDAFS